MDEDGSKLLGLPIGESFWPEFQNLEFLEEKQEDETLTPSQWSALYMQEPIPEEGAIFREADFQIWDDKNPPPVDLIVLSLDTRILTKDLSRL